MATKKSLYQLLQVSPDASPDTLKAAYDAHVAKIAGAASAEDLSNRAILRDAFEILSDPMRRKQYDERLREERVRSLASGMEGERPRPANARMTDETPDGPDRSPMEKLMYGMAALVVAGAAGGWVYSDHTRKVAAQRLEAEKLATEARKLEAEERARAEYLKLQNDQLEATRQGMEERQRQAEVERTKRQLAHDQQVQSQQAAMEERRKQAELRNAEYQRQREEQESLRRSQMQLERDRRYLNELERNRGQKF